MLSQVLELSVPKIVHDVVFLVDGVGGHPVWLGHGEPFSIVLPKTFSFEEVPGSS